VLYEKLVIELGVELLLLGLPNESRSTSQCCKDRTNELCLQWTSVTTHHWRVHWACRRRCFQLISGLQVSKL